MGRFDIILCRNVAIYFTEPDRVQLFQRMARVLEPDGSLIIGSTESITGISSAFESKRYLRSVFYQLKGA
jgi:chemotaxis protein methyltransferase CheR